MEWSRWGGGRACTPQPGPSAAPLFPGPLWAPFEGQALPIGFSSVNCLFPYWLCQHEHFFLSSLSSCSLKVTLTPKAQHFNFLVSASCVAMWGFLSPACVPPVHGCRDGGHAGRPIGWPASCTSPGFSSQGGALWLPGS